MIYSYIGKSIRGYFMGIKEYCLPLENYENCVACDGYGGVNLMMTDEKELNKWAKKLDIPEAFYGYNTCNRCLGGSIVTPMEELELVD